MLVAAGYIPWFGIDNQLLKGKVAMTPGDLH
jgi:hypothetical protein